MKSQMMNPVRLGPNEPKFENEGDNTARPPGDWQVVEDPLAPIEEIPDEKENEADGDDEN